MYENTPVINGTELRGLFCFDKKWNKELICKVALSPVSIENARLNMATEVPGWDFEYIASCCRNQLGERIEEDYHSRYRFAEKDFLYGFISHYGTT